MNEIRLKFKRRPNLFRIYLSALMIRRKGLKPGEALPLLTSECPQAAIDKEHLDRFLEITGAEGIPITYPELLVFPFHMPIIGHKDFPLLYVRMMQIRNHVVQYAPLEGIDSLRIACSVSARRTTAKGLEIDLRSILSSEGQTVWECLNTYYFPGRYGDPDPPSPLSEFMPMPSGGFQQEFSIPHQGGFRFGLLSGDFNGIHYASRYARSRGFRRSFAQSYNSLTQCVRRLPRLPPAFPVRLDAAFKGPVYYDTDLTLEYAPAGGGQRFNLYCAGDPRPCLVGAIDSAEPFQTDEMRPLSAIGT
jgi:hypothetical protein